MSRRVLDLVSVARHLANEDRGWLRLVTLGEVFGDPWKVKVVVDELVRLGAAELNDGNVEVSFELPRVLEPERRSRFEPMIVRVGVDAAERAAALDDLWRRVRHAFERPESRREIPAIRVLQGEWRTYETDEAWEDRWTGLRESLRGTFNRLLYEEDPALEDTVRAHAICVARAAPRWFGDYNRDEREVDLELIAVHRACRGVQPGSLPELLLDAYCMGTLPYDLTHEYPWGRIVALAPSADAASTHRG